MDKMRRLSSDGSKRHKMNRNTTDEGFDHTGRRVILRALAALPLVFALGGALYYAFRGKLEQQMVSASAVLLALVLTLIPDDTALVGDYRIQMSFVIIIGAVLLLSMDTFTKFLLFWTLSIFFALTVAGEKMPWLFMHLALPVSLLGAKVLDNVLSSEGGILHGATETEARPPWLQRLMPMAYAGLLALGAAGLFQKFGPGSAL